MLRKVEYTTYKRLDRKNVATTQTGYFHSFTETYVQESKGYGEGWQWISYPEALIETESGEIVRIPPESIKFLEVPMDINETELAELRRKADQWDALGYTSPHVMPEDYEQVKRDAEKWRRLMALFDTSCDKCFLGHVCGTHRKAEAVCEDIKEAMETNDER